MRSFRQRPVGWRDESYRHYLASKGVSTCRRYRAQIDYKATAGFLKGMFDDGKPKTEDFAHSMKTQYVDTLRSETVEELNKAEGRGDISFENAQHFMNDDFTYETKDFLDGTTNREQYELNVKRKLRVHMRRNDKHLRAFEW